MALGHYFTHFWGPGNAGPYTIQSSFGLVSVMLHPWSNDMSEYTAAVNDPIVYTMAHIMVLQYGSRDIFPHTLGTVT